MPDQPIIQQSLSFQANGAPFNDQFNDIYFDLETGCQQSNEVFIQANNIYQRLLQLPATFTIAETGFGTGLNFLLTLQAYQKAIKDITAKKNRDILPKLTFISVEKYPLSASQLLSSLSLIPSLAPFYQLLLDKYPTNFDQPFTAYFFDGLVELKVIFSDAQQGLSQLPTNKQGLVDAWFLDGFSPAKNPDMWTKSLFEQVARLSKPQATLATFTVAGFVKRYLQHVGFRVCKKPLSGKKEQLMFAQFQQNPYSFQPITRGYQLRPFITKPQHVSIIGGGIASACAAYALTKQGIKVTLYCQESKVAQGASSNAIGALYPLLHQQKDDISEFYQQAFWHAKALYQQLLEDGYYFSHDWCGLLEVAYKESLHTRQNILVRNKVWPQALIHQVSQQQASNIAKIPLNNGGLFMPNSGWIAPQELVQQLFNAANDTNRLRIKPSTKVESLSQLSDKTWKMHTNNGDISAEILIICGGAESIKLNIISSLPLTSTRGQVTVMQSHKNIAPLATVICHKGYLTPANSMNQHCIGATFDKNSFDTNIRKEDDLFNLSLLEKCLPEVPKWSSSDIFSAKARLRCMTPDHIPMVGAMPDINKFKTTYPHLAKDKNWKYTTPAPILENLYLITGLGARGLCTAPLLADILLADLSGTPYPVDNKLLFNLNPNRFIIRDIIRRKV